MTAPVAAGESALSRAFTPEERAFLDHEDTAAGRAVAMILGAVVVSGVILMVITVALVSLTGGVNY